MDSGHNYSHIASGAVQDTGTGTRGVWGHEISNYMYLRGTINDTKYDEAAPQAWAENDTISLRGSYFIT